MSYLGTAAVSPPDAPEGISQRRGGTGFDIRSLGPAPVTGEREVRRIEVKAALLRQAMQRFRDGYWLSVVYGAGTGAERLVTVCDPYLRLRGVEEIVQIIGYRVPAASIEAYAHIRSLHPTRHDLRPLAG